MTDNNAAVEKSQALKDLGFIVEVKEWQETMHLTSGKTVTYDNSRVTVWYSSIPRSKFEYYSIEEFVKATIAKVIEDVVDEIVSDARDYYRD
jgi:hypothetical protein